MSIAELFQTCDTMTPTRSRVSWTGTNLTSKPRRRAPAEGVRARTYFRQPADPRRRAAGPSPPNWDPKKPHDRLLASALRTGRCVGAPDRGFSEVSSYGRRHACLAGPDRSSAPDAGMSFFTVGSRPEELDRLAWTLEEGSRKFYASIAATLADNEAAKLFTDLASAEGHHKSTLLGLYRDNREGRAGGLIFRRRSRGDEDRMEGGVKVSEALVPGRRVGTIAACSRCPWPLRRIPMISISEWVAGQGRECEKRSSAAGRGGEGASGRMAAQLDKQLCRHDAETFPHCHLRGRLLAGLPGVSKDGAAIFALSQ